MPRARHCHLIPVALAILLLLWRTRRFDYGAFLGAVLVASLVRPIRLPRLAVRHKPLILLLLAYLTLAVAYSLADPVYESTDELRHFRYVRHLAVYHTLPVQQPGAPRAQSHHPPLYYALAALVAGGVPVSQEVYYQPEVNPFWCYHYWEVGDDNKNQYLHGTEEQFPFHGVILAVYIVRWLTVLIGAGVVWLTYLIGREVYPGSVALPLTGAAVVAFNPQFLYLSGAVNNDVPAALGGAVVLLLALRLVRRGPSRRLDIALGVAYGLALLTKLNLAVLLVLIELAYLLATVPRRDWRALLRGNLIVLGLAVLLAGWWFGRNYALYGDPTGLNRVNELWAGRSAGENWWAVPQGLPYLWSSLWGRFGYGQVVMPAPVYRGLLLVSSLGLLLALRRRLRAVQWLLLVHGLLFLAVVVYYIMIQPAGAMGRFLFPALPAVALLLAGGLADWPSVRATRGAAALIILSLVGLALYALVAILRPAFAPPRPLTGDEIAARPHPIAVEFDGVARLLGYSVAPTTVRPGDEVAVTLYWQPLARTDINYAVFVHLMSTVGTLIAQRDTYPGLGRYPTTAWTPGVVFADTYRLTVPETAYAPDAGYIAVGLYQLDGPRLLTADGRDAVRLDAVSIAPRPGPLPNQMAANFDSRLTLVGYALSRRAVHPGDTIRLTLYWQLPAPLGEDYRIFAHVLGGVDQVWANSDLLLPTSRWPAGEVITDTRDLTLGADVPPSLYRIEVGVYRPGGDRLSVITEDSIWRDTRILLAGIRVFPPDEQP